MHNGEVARATKEKLDRPDANDPRVVRDEARAVGLFACVRARGWADTGEKDGRGTWQPATYTAHGLVALPVTGAADGRAVRQRFVIFEPDASGELPEKHVFLAALALEYVSFLDHGNRMTAAFKALAKVRYRLHEAPTIGIERAVRKALGELERVERSARDEYHRLDKEYDYFSERLRKVTDDGFAILRADRETRWPNAVPLFKDVARLEAQRTRPNAELWLINRIRAELAGPDLGIAVETVDAWFQERRSTLTNSVVFLDALLNDNGSPFQAVGWSRSSSARLWFRAKHPPDSKEERRLAIILYAAQAQGRPLAKTTPDWWFWRSVMF